MFSNKSFLCLDFGAGSLKAAEFEVTTEGALALKNYHLKALGSDGLQESKREKALLGAIQEFLAAHGHSGKKANICAPGFQVFSKVVKLPPVDSTKVRQIIQYEAQQNIPFPFDQAVWDFQILGAAPTGEVEVMLVAIKADTVESLFRACEGSELKLELVDAAPAALCNAFRFNYGDLDGCHLLIDIGARTTNVLLFEKGKVFARTINMGANAITQEFIAESKLPYAKAEELKIKEGFVSLGGAYEEPEDPQHAALAKIARQVMTRLHIQINQTIQFYRAQHGGTAPTRLYLAGGGAIMPYLPQFFAEKFDIGIEYFNPFRNLTLAPQIDRAELAKVAHAFGEVVGLALRNLAQCPVELNLVPKSIRSQQALHRKAPYFITTMASLIAVVFAIGYFYGQVAEIKREAAAHLDRMIKPMQARADEMDRQHKLVLRARDEIDVAAGYLRDRFFWPEALVEMRRILTTIEGNTERPGHDVGVWIENLGAVAVDDLEEEQPENPMGSQVGPGGFPTWLTSNPMLFERMYPGIYKTMKEQGLFNQAQTSLSAAKPALSTNLVTINVKFRAVSLNTNSDPSANGRLAFAVADAFQKCPMFEAEGTKLIGELEEPEALAKNFGTFRFSMTLKLKNEMQL